MATRLTPTKRKSEARTLLDSPQISALFNKVRLATDAPIEPPPSRKNPLPAAIGIGLLCAIAWWCFGGLRSGVVRATLPGGSQAANPAIGETCLYRGDFYPSSGVETLQQLQVIKTGTNGVAGSPLAARGIAYAILANWFTVAFDAYYAPLALNLALCWLCAWLVARVTGVLFRDRVKSIFAATCFSLSIVTTSFVGAVGPQLLGICCCYLWTLLLVRKDADDEPIGWRSAIGLAALLGLWSLVDISSATGLAVYAVFTLKRRKLAPLFLAALCWGLLPLAQELVWRRLGIAVKPNVDLALIGNALQQHGSRFIADPLGYLGFLTIEVGNLVFNDNPLNVAICLVGLGLLPHKSRWILRVCFFVPIVVQLILLPTTSNRGAAIAGNTIVPFALLAHYGVELGRRLQSKFGADAVALPVVALVVLQGIWGYSGLYGWDFPAKALATGAFREAGTLGPTKFARLSGSPQEVPTVLGGPVRAPWFCGLVKDQRRPPIFANDRVAPYRDDWSGLPLVRRLLAAQAPILAALLIATLCLMRTWRGLGTAALFSGCIAGALLGSSTSGFAPQSLASFEGRIAVKEDEKLVGAVRLSPEFQASLEDAAERSEHVEVFVCARAVHLRAEHPVELQVAEWSSTEPRLLIPARAFLESVRARGGRVEFSIAAATGSKGLSLHSWQSTRPNGARSAELVHTDGTKESLDRFPSFEIRVIRASRAYNFQKLLERFEPLPSGDYSLVGF